MGGTWPSRFIRCMPLVLILLIVMPLMFIFGWIIYS